MSRLLNRLNDSEDTQLEVEQESAQAQIIPFPGTTETTPLSSMRWPEKRKSWVIPLTTLTLGAAGALWYTPHDISLAPVIAQAPRVDLRAQILQNQIAIDSFYSSDLPGALQAFEKLSSQNPESAAIKINLGITLRHAGKIKESQQAFEAALKLDPTSPAALEGLGRLQLDARHLSEAEALLKRSLDTGRSAPSTLLELGRVAELQSRWSVAAGYYNRYLKVSNSPPAISHLLTKRLEKMPSRKEQEHN